MAMTAHTILLEFYTTSPYREGLADDIDTEVIAGLTNQLKLKSEVASSSSFAKVVSTQLDNSNDTLSIHQGPRSSVVSVRSYFPSGLVTVNVDYFLQDGEKPLLTLEECANLEKTWGKVWGKTKPAKTLPSVRRGLPFDTYFLASDERLLEYDVDKVVFDKQSPFQHVQILHSITFGNMLVLDDLQNLAESDLVYTESLMCRGKEDYRDKEVLILGGGDGALLHELRKEGPKFVTMIEIDELVMQICKVHLKSACGNVLDNYKGPDYEIIVGDCIDYMKSCGPFKFDYVFADLTDIPISQTPQGEVWDFIRLILNLSFGVLKEDGKYMTHGNGISSPRALKMYEDQLGKLDMDVVWTKTSAFVPSFMEQWVFYQVQRKNKKSL